MPSAVNWRNTRKTLRKAVIKHVCHLWGLNTIRISKLKRYSFWHSQHLQTHAVTFGILGSLASGWIKSCGVHLRFSLKHEKRKHVSLACSTQSRLVTPEVHTRHKHFLKKRVTNKFFSTSCHRLDRFSQKARVRKTAHWMMIGPQISHISTPRMNQWRAKSYISIL